MSMETIVAVFDTAAHATAAVQELEGAGVPPDAITQHSGGAATGSSTTGAPAPEKGFWSSLFGGEPEQGSDISVYDRSMQSGSTVVSVKAPAQSLTQVMEILERHGPVDIDDRAATYATTQTSSTTGGGTMLAGAASTQRTSAAQVTGTAGPNVVADQATGGTIQLAEESLAVGKRLLNTGTTRIRRYVIETPVEEQVTLHSEKVVVERRPVTGQVTGTVDFTDKVLEATETDEQAVVSKTARIVEEVGLRKEASDRTETVRDTVRKQEVEIIEEPVVKSTTTATTTTPAKPKI
ncbi:MAG: YsnF/AvaK domain-containing protein [Janthinobacterium lividum]